MKPRTYKRPPRAFTTGRARIVVKPRSSGWFDWYLITFLGDRISGDGFSGFEKLKEDATKLARAAAAKYNEELAKQPDVHPPDRHNFIPKVAPKGVIYRFKM